MRGRARLPLVVAAAVAAGVALAQTLPLKPGNYENKSTTQVQLSPEMAAKISPQMLQQMQQARTIQQCITEGDLDKMAQRLAGKGDDSRCQMTSKRMQGNHLSFTLQCPNATSKFDGTFASTSFQGTMVIATDQGMKANVQFNAHRTGECTASSTSPSTPPSPPVAAPPPK
jgi:Protein of unknown function (DUF3617)